MIETVTWLQVEPEFNGQRVVRGKVVRATSRRPNPPAGGTVLVKLIINLPERAFDSFATVHIDVPEDAYVVSPIVTIDPIPPDNGANNPGESPTIPVASARIKPTGRK